MIVYLISLLVIGSAIAWSLWKAPSDKEPVIPGRSAAVLAVAGLNALGKPFSDDTVFRPEIFAALSGLEPGQILTPEAVAKVIEYYTRSVERLVRLYPEQWFWMHNRWKTRPSEEQSQTPSNGQDADA